MLGDILMLRVLPLAEQDRLKYQSSACLELVHDSTIGTTALDAIIHIISMGLELIIGARQTGKSMIAIDGIIVQDACNCIYVRVGQKTLQSLIPNCNKSL